MFVGQNRLARVLMTRLADRQFRQFILDLQLFALQLVQSFFVGVGMELFFLDFLLDRLVAALEFDDMTLQGHAKPPF
jgi:hypothetical protein